MLQITGLDKTYRGAKKKAVEDLSLRVFAGEIFGFLGPNGAGKTTTIKAIVGLTAYDGGTITVDGFDVSKNPIEAKHRIGFAPDTPELYEKLTAREYLSFIADVYGVGEADRNERSKELLEMFGLTAQLDGLIQSLSHGTKQKLALCAALVHRPSLLVLDEPMTGLDPRSSRLFKDHMRRMCDRGGAVFFSTHILEVAERLCDRVGIINQGRLVAIGTLEELRQKMSGEDSLETIFLELTRDEGFLRNS